MTYTVVGAGGFQGGAVVRRLLAEGHRVRGVSRDGRTLPGTEPFAADLLDAGRLAAAFEGATGASVTLPMLEDPAQAEAMAATLVRAARSAGLGRVVLNLGNRVPAVPTRVAVFEGRRAATETLLGSGLPAVVLRAPVYLDNLLAPWVAGPLVHQGVLGYPLPADARVSWLSHADLAEATLAALTVDGVIGQALDIGGPEALTGPELAAAVGSALGREVVYVAQDVEEFATGLAHALGPAMAEGVAGTYRWIAAEDPSLYAESPGTKLLGVEPAPARAWAAAQPWRELA